MSGIPRANFSSYRQDYAHPETRRQLQKYPVFQKTASELWHTQKWLTEAPDNVLVPMIRLEDGRNFYIHELTHLKDRRWFIPCRFFEFDGKMWSVGHIAKRNTV